MSNLELLPINVAGEWRLGGGDVGLLREQGYELQHLVAFDLFPSTHHVEAVARLTAIV